MWNLSFISESNFYNHVESTIQHYGTKLEPYDLKMTIVLAFLLKLLQRNHKTFHGVFQLMDNRKSTNEYGVSAWIGFMPL
ncbi:MAG: hypothetical protein FWF76_04460 [Oscillospiraceae bacterium]|nr:hypothetical protein [Oscillospiraceae bacterium]